MVVQAGVAVRVVEDGGGGAEQAAQALWQLWVVCSGWNEWMVCVLERTSMQYMSISKQLQTATTNNSQGLHTEKE